MAVAQISVIVPVYKVEPYLHRCVDSILAQTFTDFELILIDDGSPDNCGEICDEYAEKDHRIHVIHQKNGGLSAARNAGIDWAFSNSDSQWLSFIDSDDWVHPEYLKLLFEATQRFSVRLSQCGKAIIDKECAFDEPQEDMAQITPEEQYIKWYSSFAWGKLYDKELFKDIRFPVGIQFEDVTIWYKILFSLDFLAIVEAKLYYYFQRTDSIMNTSWTPAKLAQVRAWDEQLVFLEKKGNASVLKEAVKRACWVYEHHIEEIEKCSTISAAEKKRYQMSLKKRIRTVLHDYRRDLEELNLYRYYFALAYPRIDWVYWTAVGICTKFKR